MENPGPACLRCVGLGDLEFLPAGDALLTRRVKAKSARHAVVVRFSKNRGRYERQGLLVEPEALQQVERDLEATASSRVARRYSAWTPAFSMIGRHRSICEASLARCASGVAWSSGSRYGLDAGELLGDRLVLHDLSQRLVQGGDDRLGVPTGASLRTTCR